MQASMDKRQALTSNISKLAIQQGIVITTAESCTGGGVAHALTAIPGSSAWFEKGFVTYSNQAKQDMLGVKQTTLVDYGAVSKETVVAMAEGALARAKAQLSVAISGIAGPDGGSDDKPVGTVWFAWSKGNAGCQAACYHFDGDRQAVREQAITVALSGLLKCLKET